MTGFQLNEQDLIVIGEKRGEEKALKRQPKGLVGALNFKVDPARLADVRARSGGPIGRIGRQVLAGTETAVAEALKAGCQEIAMGVVANMVNPVSRRLADRDIVDKLAREARLKRDQVALVTSRVEFMDAQEEAGLQRRFDKKLKRSRREKRRRRMVGAVGGFVVRNLGKVFKGRKERVVGATVVEDEV